MRFFIKFILLVAGIAALILLEVYSKPIEISISFLGYNLQISIYIICLFILIKWLLQLGLKYVKKIFLKFKHRDFYESVKKLAISILQNTSANFVVPIQLQPIKSAIQLKNNMLGNKTGIKEIDIYITKLEISSMLLNHHYSSAINLANNAISDNYKNIYIIQDEILEIAKQSKIEKLKFDFNPKKSKYNLSKDFIKKYYTELGLIDFSISKNIHILEKLYDPENITVAKYLLDFKTEKEALNIIKNMFKTKPDRTLAYPFLKKYNEPDGLDVAINLLKNISDDNTEKIWFLLIIATNFKNYQKIKSLLQKLHSYPLETARFYIDNYDALKNDNEIIEIIRGNNYENKIT